MERGKRGGGGEGGEKMIRVEGGGAGESGLKSGHVDTQRGSPIPASLSVISADTVSQDGR